MAHYRKIDVRIWNDKAFNSFTDQGKLAFIFLITHPHLEMIGAMRGTIAGLAQELGWSEKAFREALKEALLKSMVKVDERASFIWLPNFLKYNKPESPNVVKSWENALDRLPECELKVHLIQCVKDSTKALPEGFQKALPEVFAKSMSIQEQEQEQEQYKEKILSLESSDPPSPLNFNQDAKEVLIFLNKKSGKNFEPVKSNLDFIVNRMNEGGTLTICKQIIALKCRTWLTDEKMKYALRPKTLFNKTNFWQYKGELIPVEDSEQ